jgi:hypothetical protein
MILLSLAGGVAVLTLGIRVFALAFLKGAAEAVGLGSGLDDICAIGDAVEQRLA